MQARLARYGLSDQPSMTPPRPDHKLAQALDLARREAGLTTAELAKALSFNPRTVRRYLNGERRPERDTVVRWELVCNAPPGTLIAPYDGAPESDPPPSRARFPLRSAVAAVAVIVAVSVALGVELLLRGGEQPNLGQAAQKRSCRCCLPPLHRKSRRRRLGPRHPRP